MGLWMWVTNHWLTGMILQVAPENRPKPQKERLVFEQPRAASFGEGKTGVMTSS